MRTDAMRWACAAFALVLLAACTAAPPVAPHGAVPRSGHVDGGVVPAGSALLLPE